MLSVNWHELIEFIDRREPGYKTSVKGANAAQMKQLEDLHSLPLPHVYASFMRAFGEDFAGFDIFQNHYATVGGLIAFSQAIVASGWEYHYPRERFLPIGYEFEDVDMVEGDIFLDVKNGDPDDPPVVLLETQEEYDPGDEMVMGRAFSSYVQKMAFFKYETRELQLTMTTGQRASRDFQIVVDVARKHGLRTEVKGGPGTWIGSREEMAMMLRANTDGTLIVRLSGDERAELTKVAVSIEDRDGGDWALRWDEP